MKYLHLYKIPIGYMLLYTVAILLSGVWLFLLSQGLASSDIVMTLSKITDTPLAKSLHSFVEVATPHMFAIGVLVFIAAHFMLFSTKIPQKFSLQLSLVLFLATLFNIFTYLLIIVGIVVSGWIKLLSMGLFVLVFTVLIGLVAFSL